MFDTFYSKISEFIDIHIPLKQLSKKESQFKTKPWITSAIRTSIKIKNKFYKKFLKTKSSYYQTKFKVYRNKLNHLIKISKRKYYNNDYFSIHLNDGKRIWKGMKQIIRTTSQERQALSKVVLNDIEITDPTSIANTFNNYFANIGSDLASAIPSVINSAYKWMSPLKCYNKGTTHTRWRIYTTQLYSPHHVRGATTDLMLHLPFFLAKEKQVNKGNTTEKITEFTNSGNAKLQTT